MRKHHIRAMEQMKITGKFVGFDDHHRPGRVEARVVVGRGALGGSWWAS